MGIVKDVLYKVATKSLLSSVSKQSIYPYYHIVRDEKVPHIEYLYQYKNRKQFEYDLDVLVKNYEALDPKDLLDNRTADNQFLITFDDGLQEVYTQIYPILKRKNIKAIFFINPDFIDNKEGLYKHYISIIIKHLERVNFDKATLNKISELFSFKYTLVSEFKHQLLNIKYDQRDKVRVVLDLLNINISDYLKEHRPYISKEQIQEMMDAGFYFGGHTMSHPPLIQLSHEEQKKEIIDSIEWLKNNFKINYSMFAFPFSDRAISKELLNELFEYDPRIKIFGNSGLKKDMDERIIQRFSLEHPGKQIEKQIVTENLYKYFNKAIGKYRIKRK